MKKLIYLEGLRGTAAVFVVLSHFVQVFYPALFEINKTLTHNDVEITIAKYPTNLFYNGHFAVCLFFVLSGYVLSIKYLEKKGIETVYASLVKRYFRLAIPVVCSIGIAYVLLLLNAYFYGEIKHITKSTMIDPYSAINHNGFQVIKLALYDVFINGVNSYNPVLWTMKIELLGSIFVFLLLPIVGFIKNWFIKFPMYVFFMLFITKVLGLIFVPFILGLLLCDLKVSKKVIFKFNNQIVNVTLLIAGLFFASFPYIETTNTIYDFLRFSKLESKELAFEFYHIIGAIILLIVLIRSTGLQIIFSKEIFNFLGKISFSLYLTHFIILCSFSAFLFNKLYFIGFSYNISFFLTLLISIPLMLTIAFFMYKYVDTLAIKITGKLYRLLFKPLYFFIFIKKNKEKNLAA